MPNNKERKDCPCGGHEWGDKSVHTETCPRPAHSTEEMDTAIADYNESKKSGTLDENYPVIAKVEEPQGESWEEEFESNRPTSNGLLANGPDREESETRKFGYKYREGGTIHEVTDWGNIKIFILKWLSQTKREAERKTLQKVWVNLGVTMEGLKHSKLSVLDEATVAYKEGIKLGTGNERQRILKIVEGIAEGERWIITEIDGKEYWHKANNSASSSTRYSAINSNFILDRIISTLSSRIQEEHE